MSLKFQITLPDRLAVELRRAAAQRRIPLAQFIRETMEDRLRQRRGGGGDPFDSVTGLVESEETGLSGRVDDILYR
jgi:hypothetical protein